MHEIGLMTEGASPHTNTKIAAPARTGARALRFHAALYRARERSCTDSCTTNGGVYVLYSGNHGSGAKLLCAGARFSAEPVAQLVVSQDSPQAVR